MGGCCSKDGEAGREGLECKEDLEEYSERGGVWGLKFHENLEEEEEEEEGELGENGTRVEEGGARVRLKGPSRFASMFSQQGWKGVNQDAMTLWEDFGGAKDRIFCGVFDGHGPLGHRVACHVRDNLPLKLSSALNSLQPLESIEFRCDSDDQNAVGDDKFSSWKAIFLKAFEELDKELGSHASIDCICSGTTAVSLVKQREHLVIANLGDSRAILCTQDEKNQPIAVQLTVDLKPNLPSEAERIRSCKGRVFALDEEPDVHRMWLPDEDCPGLAMARAFGDFCLKDFGLISTPQISYRKLSDKDEFVVLASDGVWDVLSNKEVVKIVSSASKRSDAAKHVVDRAVRAWRCKHPTSKVDDCAVVCLFLKHPLISPKAAFHSHRRSARSRDLSSSESFKTAKSEDVFAESEEKEDWTALEGVSRVNSLIKVPRFAGVLSWRKRSMKVDEEVD